MQFKKGKRAVGLGHDDIDDIDIDLDNDENDDNDITEISTDGNLNGANHIPSSINNSSSTSMSKKENNIRVFSMEECFEDSSIVNSFIKLVQEVVGERKCHITAFFFDCSKICASLENVLLNMKECESSAASIQDILFELNSNTENPDLSCFGDFNVPMKYNIPDTIMYTKQILFSANVCEVVKLKREMLCN